MTFAFDVERGADSVRVASGFNTLVTLGNHGRPVPIPARMREALESDAGEGNWAAGDR